jgi:hypothetical protein
MGRILKTRGTPGMARMLVADFQGGVKEGATFGLVGSQTSLHDGDLVAFRYPDGLRAGITVEEDEDGLFCFISFEYANIRIGLEAQGNGCYAFRPAAHHLELWPKLAAAGEGIPIG